MVEMVCEFVHQCDEHLKLKLIVLLLRRHRFRRLRITEKAYLVRAEGVHAQDKRSIDTGIDLATFPSEERIHDSFFLCFVIDKSSASLESNFPDSIKRRGRQIHEDTMHVFCRRREVEERGVVDPFY